LSNFVHAQQYEFTKLKIPNAQAKKVDFSHKLMKYISLQQYNAAIKQKEIKP